jgi:quercetin dioxygenase-like cupin family protein
MACVYPYVEDRMRPTPGSSPLWHTDSQSGIVPGWLYANVFLIETSPQIPFLWSHWARLDEAMSPHELLEHPQEEIKVILAGEAELWTQADPEPVVQVCGEGTVAYWPPMVAHTLRARSASAVYWTLKWLRPGHGRSDASPSVIARASDVRAVTSQSGSAREIVLELVAGLVDRLRVSRVTIPPGSGFVARAHGDTALVVLDGELEVSRQVVNRWGTVYLETDELHYVRNAGGTPLRLLMAELLVNCT